MTKDGKDGVGSETGHPGAYLAWLWGVFPGEGRYGAEIRKMAGPYPGRETFISSLANECVTHPRFHFLLHIYTEYTLVQPCNSSLLFGSNMPIHRTVCFN